jgi:hypothetical protein
MTLQNLAKIGQLKPHDATPAEIQSLPLSLGISNDRWIVLDALRTKRNQNDYTGAPLSKAEAEQAIEQARALLLDVESFLKTRRSALLK